METIRELLDRKGSGPVYTIGPEETVFEAVTRMVGKNIGAIVVTDDNVIKGIITERDYLRFITVKGRTARDTPVKDVMTRKVIYVTLTTDLDEVMTIMTEQRIRHLPVLDEGRLAGIVSIGDVIKQRAKDQEVRLRTLEEYIADKYPGPAGQQQARA
jgi:CBS domain-containing protein